MGSLTQTSAKKRLFEFELMMGGRTSVMKEDERVERASCRVIRA
jgi:hypothetical protein